MKPFLFIALDGLVQREKETLSVVEQLISVSGNFGFKINLDYLLKKGLKAALEPIQQFGRPVFADLKMWNGTRTMVSVIENLVAMKVDYTNVYTLADDLLPKTIKITEGTKTKVLGLTILTHFSEAYCQKHFKRSLQETVRHFAEIAVETGCHGIILPGTALEVVKNLNVIKVIPGVRPSWYRDKRHKEKVEPKTAIKKGANILVCGSPIMKNRDPVEALKKVLSEINSAKINPAG